MRTGGKREDRRWIDETYYLRGCDGVLPYHSGLIACVRLVFLWHCWTQLSGGHGPCTHLRLEGWCHTRECVRVHLPVVRVRPSLSICTIVTVSQFLHKSVIFLSPFTLVFALSLLHLIAPDTTHIRPAVYSSLNASRRVTRRPEAFISRPMDT